MKAIPDSLVHGVAPAAEIKINLSTPGLTPPKETRREPADLIDGLATFDELQFQLEASMTFLIKTRFWQQLKERPEQMNPKYEKRTL
jgi:hypothetical protein